MRILPGFRHAQGLGGAQLEATLLVVNIATVFFATRYLFEMNSRAIFFGGTRNPCSRFLASGIVSPTLCLGWEAIQLSNSAISPYPVNPTWFPSLLLSKSPSGDINGPLAFAIGATELFVATVLCGRVNGFAIGPSVGAGWLVTLTTWQLFGMPAIVTIWFFYPNHAEVVAVSVIAVSAALHLGEGPVRRSIAFAGVIFLCLTHILLADPTSLIPGFASLGDVQRSATFAVVGGP